MSTEKKKKKALEADSRETVRGCSYQLEQGRPQVPELEGRLQVVCIQVLRSGMAYLIFTATLRGGHSNPLLTWHEIKAQRN